MDWKLAWILFKLRWGLSRITGFRRRQLRVIWRTK